MGCACGKRREPRSEGSSALRLSTPKTNSYSIYETSTLPNCDIGYYGTYVNSSIYIVGLGTGGERVFKRSDVTQAVAYAKESKLMIAHLPTRQFCHEAMVQFLGS